MGLDMTLEYGDEVVIFGYKGHAIEIGSAICIYAGRLNLGFDPIQCCMKGVIKAMLQPDSDQALERLNMFEADGAVVVRKESVHWTEREQKRFGTLLGLERPWGKI